MKHTQSPLTYACTSSGATRLQQTAKENNKIKSMSAFGGTTAEFLPSHHRCKHFLFHVFVTIVKNVLDRWSHRCVLDELALALATPHTIADFDRVQFDVHCWCNGLHNSIQSIRSCCASLFSIIQLFPCVEFQLECTLHAEHVYKIHQTSLSIGRDASLELKCIPRSLRNQYWHRFRWTLNDACMLLACICSMNCVLCRGTETEPCKHCNKYPSTTKALIRVCMHLHIAHNGQRLSVTFALCVW